MSQFRMWTVLGAALGMGLAAASASALIVGGPAGISVSPVYFNGGGNFGLATGVSSCPCISAEPSGDWQLHDLSIQLNLQQPVIQNPQSPLSSLNPAGLAGNPTAANPFVADSIWTVTNLTDGPLNNAFLVFEGVNLAGTALVPGGYPNIPVGIDRNLVSIVHYTFGSPGSPSSLFFAALPLGSLSANGTAGDSTQIRVRYIVAGPLPVSGGNLVMPELETVALINVPEPSALLLVGSGLVLVAAADRRRWA